MTYIQSGWMREDILVEVLLAMRIRPKEIRVEEVDAEDTICLSIY
jgi:hypothetical protein